MTWLFAALGLARKALQALLGLVVRYPLQCALVASLCLSGWLWMGRRDAIADLADCRAGRKADRAAFEQAATTARRLAEQQKAAEEARHLKRAKEADHAHQTALADARARADAFIARNRLRPQGAGGSPGGTAGPAQGGDPGVPDGLPADPVMVEADDVLACTDATIYALKAREWALGLAGE